MKKMYKVMTAAGIILAVITAGGADANTVSMWQLALLGAASSVLVLMGTHFMLRGEKV